MNALRLNSSDVFARLAMTLPLSWRIAPAYRTPKSFKGRREKIACS